MNGHTFVNGQLKLASLGHCVYPSLGRRVHGSLRRCLPSECHLPHFEGLALHKGSRPSVSGANGPTLNRCGGAMEVIL